jgi:hypothetical protein
LGRDAVEAHCSEIDRCNQRGGRMLSIVDLVEAGTVSRDLAAYALSAVGHGASFMVGANPGGLGKTTVMGALLNFVPADVELFPADGMTAIDGGMRDTTRRRCYVCHEIGAGHWYAYLWGEELRAYFDLAAAGHMLATNLHADTYEEAHAQVVGRNGVSEDTFRRMNLILFLHARRRGGSHERYIASAWESDGESPHRCVFTADGGFEEAVPRETEIVDGLLASGARTIEEVRTYICRARSGQNAAT